MGLSLPDRVFRLIGNKPRLGAGRPSSLIIVGDSLPVFIGPPPYPRQPYPRPALPHARAAGPVQQGPAGDSPPLFVGARRSVLHQ